MTTSLIQEMPPEENTGSESHNYELAKASSGRWICVNSVLCAESSLHSVLVTKKVDNAGAVAETADTALRVSFACGRTSELHVLCIHIVGNRKRMSNEQRATSNEPQPVSVPFVHFLSPHYPQSIMFSKLLRSIATCKADLPYSSSPYQDHED
jgi:hypothetical protein